MSRLHRRKSTKELEEANAGRLLGRVGEVGEAEAALATTTDSINSSGLNTPESTNESEFSNALIP